MFDKLKEFFSSPYAAPLTDPAKNVATIAYMPIRDFVEAVRDSFTGNRSDDIWLVRYARSIGDAYGFGATAMGFFGAAFGIVGGAGAGIYAATGLTTLGTAAQLGAGFALAVGGAGIGAVAGPFALAAIVGMAALTAGVAVGVVPGILTGAYKAVKHALTPKPEPALEVPELTADTVVALKEKAAKRTTTAEEVMDAFARLPASERARLETQLKGPFEKSAPKVTPEAAPETVPLPPPDFTSGDAFRKLGKLGAG